MTDYAYKHRPLSSILAPAADPRRDEGQNENQPRDEQGRFTSPEQQTQESDLPEKYRGKTAAEIAEMHMNAEKELGRMRNEVGTYRGLVNDLTSLQRTPSEPQTVEQEQLDVSGDELLLDPARAIDKVVTARLNERERKQETAAAATKYEIEEARLLSDFPDLNTIVASDEFQKFAARTESRQQDFMTAANGQGLEQVRAARRLLEDYKDFTSALTPPSAADDKPEEMPTQSPVEQARRASTEGAGPSGPVSTKPIIYEADVLKKIQTDPDGYRSPSYQAELMSAMREGRYRRMG